MEIIKVIKENENPLFKRKEIELEVTSETTPSKKEVDELFSKKYSSSPDKIRIGSIKGGFGVKTFRISANIYETREDMFKTERFSKKEKEKIKKIEEENKPAPEPATEKKAEEPKVEEPKPEEKKQDIQTEPKPEEKSVENKVEGKTEEQKDEPKAKEEEVPTQEKEPAPDKESSDTKEVPTQELKEEKKLEVKPETKEEVKNE